MESKRHPIIANHHFSLVSSECQLLFDDRYYFGCIALSQSVAEALARFMYEKWTKNKPEETFYGNIKQMRKYEVKPDVTKLLIEIHGGQQRNDFHHLNKNVPTDYKQLQSIATGKIDALNKSESQIFDYEEIDGRLKPKYEQYWIKKAGCYSTYLRITR